MADDAQYSFLGWMRRGVIGMADAGSLHPTGRLSVPLQLQVTGDGEQERTGSVTRTARLYGPGDVSGISESAVVRTVPRRHVRDFEANFLAAIEFYDEDFPWRYTPALAQGGRLRPWLWLVVLGEGEYARRGVSAGKLPAITIPPPPLASAFPDPDTTWAWAHVHLNATVTAPPGQVSAARQAVRQLLDGNPNLGCSRLLCPRRLRPDARYTAFLVPAFEKGRLAGLGRPEREVDQVPNAAPSWPKRDAVQGALEFPVYYEWEFSTSGAGDFEQLARLLRPFDARDLDPDAHLLDIQEPGWGLRYRSLGPGRKHPGAVALESALRIPGVDSALAFGKDPADGQLSRAVADLLNLGVGTGGTGSASPSGANPFFGSDLDDDPMVLPPAYGSFYRQSTKLTPAAPGSWYDHANLNPVYRAAAGQGAAVVRRNQEEYVDRAWDQLRQQMEARSVAQRWQLSLQASQKLFAKRLEASLSITLDPSAPGTVARARQEVQMFRAVNLTAPMHAALRSGPGSFAASIRGSRYGGAYTPGFAKVTRSGGPLMRRLDNRASAAPTTLFFHPRPRPPALVSPLRKAVTAALHVLDQPAGRMPPPTLPPNVAGMQILSAMLARDGLAGLTACKTALTSLEPHLQHLSIMTAPAPNNQLYASIADQVRPSRTLPARLRTLLATPASPSPAEAERIDLPHLTVEFPEPMYRELADRSPDYIMPGLDRLPPNSVVMLAPDAPFIEAYLLGLNHEMAREFLWRELPITLDATFFRQFWDVRDNPAASRNPESFKDIVPVRQWASTALGAPQHRPPGMSGSLTVVVIRGDLFRKYPHTEVYMQKAAWLEDPVDHRSFRQADLSLPANTRAPLFSARIEPDYTLLGFQLDATDAKGDPAVEQGRPGWYFALKERAGDVSFGLDVDASVNDPSWPALEEVAENQCIDAESARFKSLPRYGAGSEKLAAMLYQRPFALYVHASRLLTAL
ncbi:MAG TPA: hypothetical protein VHF87_00645 [Methylomirabilota bacterium]|jgi:hypothetical protein|nr:hypothetical protein [Methylomirabilota bacterium]